MIENDVFVFIFKRQMNDWKTLCIELVDKTMKDEIVVQQITRKKS